MNSLMIIIGITMCTIAGKSIIDTKKKHADLGRSNKRKNICLNVLSLLVGIGGIIIGSGVFYQYIVNAEFKCLITDGVQCPQTAGENGKLFGLAIFIKSTLH